MQLIQNLKQATADAIQSIYQVQIKSEQVLVNATKPEIEGDYTIVLFAFVKQLGKSPDELGNALGEAVMAKMPGTITAFNIVKGFLNFTISDQFWLDYIQATDTSKLVTPTADPKKIMVEYSSPNTNKPLHLGHVRNNLLGYSVAEILKG
mgnify:FL=1